METTGRMIAGRSQINHKQTLVHLRINKIRSTYHSPRFNLIAHNKPNLFRHHLVLHLRICSSCAVGKEMHFSTEVSYLLETTIDPDPSQPTNQFEFLVVPLCIAGMGSLFLYNRSKNLPHKLSRYALVFFGSYTIGKMSYADELRKRIMTNPSNTPFMQATRKLLKLNPIVSDEFGSNQASDFAQDTTFTSTWGGSPDVSSVSEFEIKGPNPFGEGTNFGESGSIGDTNREESKPLLSYEELRARNRGLTK